MQSVAEKTEEEGSHDQGIALDTGLFPFLGQKVSLEQTIEKRCQSVVCLSRHGGGAAALRRAQTAWEAFADAECTYAHAIWGQSAYREVAGADCRLNTIARRAIQLRAQIGPTG